MQVGMVSVLVMVVPLGSVPKSNTGCTISGTKSYPPQGVGYPKLVPPVTRSQQRRTVYLFWDYAIELDRPPHV